MASERFLRSRSGRRARVSTRSLRGASMRAPSCQPWQAGSRRIVRLRRCLYPILLTARMRIPPRRECCTLAFTPDDTAHYRIVTAGLWHAAVGLAKCVALGVDGAKAYTTVA